MRRTKDGLYKRGSFWWTRDPATGRRVSTHCRDREAARAWRAERERVAADPTHAAANAARLEDWVERTIAHKRQRRSAGTASMYQVKLGHALRVLGDCRLSDVTPSAVDRYVAQREEEGADPGTVRLEVVCLVQLVKLARRAGVWAGDPAALRPVGLPGQGPARERWLTRDEVDLLRATLRPERFAVVAAAIASSARLSELYHLDPAEDWDAARGVVRLRGTKTTDADREVPILSVMRPLWDEALPYLPTQWKHLNREVSRAIVRAGLPAASPNDLRRTFASWLIQAGVDRGLVARMMGHRDSRMVERVYGRATAEQVATLAERTLSTQQAMQPRGIAPETSYLQSQSISKTGAATREEYHGKPANDHRTRWGSGTKTTHRPDTWALAYAFREVMARRAA